MLTTAPFYLRAARGTGTLTSTCPKSHMASKQGWDPNPESLTPRGHTLNHSSGPEVVRGPETKDMDANKGQEGAGLPSIIRCKG